MATTHHDACRAPADTAAARATSTPTGKENGSAAASPVASTAPILSPQAWIPKIKEKKADRSVAEDPEYLEAKAAWLSKMNAEFADVDSYALAEEPIADGAKASRTR